MLYSSYPNEYGDTVTVRCKRGFEVHGRNYLLCQANKSWNHPVPTCELQPNCSFDNPREPTCGYRNPGNGWIVYRAWATGGYFGKALSLDSFLVSPIFPDDWSANSVCIKLQYQLLQGDLSVRSVTPVTKTYWRNHRNEVKNRWLDIAVDVKFEAEFQYKIAASGGTVYIDNIVVSPESCEDHCKSQPCQNGGTCENRISRYDCFCTVDFEGDQCQHDRKCKPPSKNIRNGNLTLPIPGLLLPDIGIYYSCHKNYKFSGYKRIVTTKRISCIRRHLSSAWFPLPSGIGCVDVTCQFRPNPHVRTKYPQESWKVGDEIIFECSEGYEFTGEFQKTATCGEDERWTAPSPRCQKIRCPRINIPNMVDMKYSNEYGDTVTVQCEYGFEIHGDENLHCQANKTWNHEIPTCERVYCPTISIENGLQSYSGRYRDRVSIECQLGYEIHGIENLTCLASRSWTAEAPTCQRIRCDTIQIKNMVPINQSKYFGDEVNITCIKGYELHGVSALTCHWDGHWNLTHSTCERVKCAAPSEVLHSQNMTRTQYVYKDTYAYTCEDGYRISGENSIVCGSDGQWSHPPPNCTLITCPHPHIYQGHATYSGNRSVWLPESIANFTCDVGYRLNGTSVVQCQANGSWDSEMPTCSRIACDHIRITNMEPIVQPKYYEDNVTIECRPGFEASGASHVVCQYDGTWFPDLPCCKRIKCDMPAEVVHARNKMRKKYHYEERYQYECDGGYKITGKNDMVCGSDGRWSHASPSCELITCPIPQLSNGYVGRLENNTSWLPETMANFSCKLGYTLNGTNIASCQSDGTWDSEIPTCSKIQCSLIHKPGMKPIKQPRYYEDNITIECIPGYNRKGAENVVCQENGLWHPNLPLCKKVKCPGLEDIENAEPVGNRTFKFEDTFSYICEQGYRIVGKNVLKCMGDGEWSFPKPQCTLITCPPLNISHSDMFPPHNPTWIPGNNATVSCHAGYEYVGSQELKCLSNGSWIPEIGICTKISCPKPEASKTVVVRPENIEWTPGENASFSCIDGHELSGSQMISCQSDGSWNDTAPNCTRVKCTTPVKVEHAQNTSQLQYEYEDTYVYECERGYNVNGINKMICGSDGQWSHSPPICVLITCDQPQLSHGYVTSMDNSSQWSLDKSVNFSCIPGYTLRGKNTATCQRDGTWDSEIPACSKTTCSEFEVDKTVVVRPQNVRWAAGDNATFSCIDGYELSGPQLISCQNDGAWSDVAPNCSKKICSVPENIPHAETVPNKTFLYGESYNFSCVKGYRISGNNILTCMADGKWSNASGISCQEIVCEELHIDQATLVNSRKLKWRPGDIATFSCDEGYTTDGPNHTACQEDGAWSGPVPRCLQMYCGSVPHIAHGLSRAEPKHGVLRQTYTYAGCERAYIMVGSRQITCEENGWTTPPECKEREPTANVTYEGYEYILYLDEELRSNYSAAQEYCKEIGGTLAVIYKYDVMIRLRRMLNAGRVTGPDSRIYIGLQRQEGTWGWNIDMIPLQDKRIRLQPHSGNWWKTPNEIYSQGECGTIERYSCWHQGCYYFWNNDFCNSARPFICQRQQRPTITTTYDGHEYLAYTEDKIKSNYSDAKTFCKSLGGNLAVFYKWSTLTNMDRMLGTVQESLTQLYSHMYIGLRRPYSTWRWDPDMISYTSIEPPTSPYSRSLRLSRYGRCGTLVRNCWISPCQYYLQDGSCHIKRSFICQRRVRCPKIEVKNMRDLTYPNEYGDRVIVSCKLGFEVHGNFSLHCQANGEWDHPLPTCQQYM